MKLFLKKVTNRVNLLFFLFLSFLPVGVQAALLENPLAKPNETDKFITPQALIGRIVQGILGLVGVIAIVMFIWAGIQIVLGLNSGNESRFAGGKKTLLYAIIGLVVASVGFLVVQQIITVFEAAVYY